MKVTTDACLFGAWVAKEIQSLEGKISIADIGAGTGLLSLMIAQQNPVVRLEAIEIDRESYEQANENVKQSPWSDKITLHHGDAVKLQFPSKFDVIISNPPFYENELKSEDARKNIAHHNEGLLFSRLMELIKENLVQDGHFFLLLPYKRNEEIIRFLKGNDFTANKIVLVKPTVNSNYFRILLHGSLNKNEHNETILDEIAIKNEKQEYTSSFTRLLKDYYLYL